MASDIFDEVTETPSAPQGDVFDEVDDSNAARKEALRREAHYNYLRSGGPLLDFFARPQSVIPPLLLPPEDPGSIENVLRKLPLGAGDNEALREERVTGISSASRSVEEGVRAAGQTENLPLLPLAFVPGGASAMGLLFGGQALGAGAGEASVGLQQGDPEMAGRGAGQVILGGAMAVPAIRSAFRRAVVPEQASKPVQSKVAEAVLTPDEQAALRAQLAEEHPGIAGEIETKSAGDIFDAALEAEAVRAQEGLDAGTRTTKDAIPPAVEVPKTIVRDPKVPAQMSPSERMALQSESEPMSALREHYSEIQRAYQKREPINAEAADRYEPDVEGSTKTVGEWLLQSGYVKQGDLYVIDPKAPLTGRQMKQVAEDMLLKHNAKTSKPEIGSVGPGAASPAELNARRQAAVRGVPPPNSTPPVVVEAGSPVPPGKPSVAVGRKPSDFSIINRINSPQFTYWFGKLGQFAKSAWERIALGEFAIREGAGRDMAIHVEGLLQSLPRPLRKQGGKAFFDVLDGKTVEQVRAEWEGKPSGERVIKATEQVRGRLEEIRTTIRDIKRDSYSAYLLSLDKGTLTELWKKNIGEAVDVAAYTKEQLSDGLSRNQFSDDWGIADGSYLPHLFMGQWKVTAKLPGSSEATFAFRAKTPAEAQARIFKAAKDNPDLANAQWSIDADTVIPGDAVRLGDRNFWRLVGEMKRQALEGVNVKEAMTGIIGRKASRQKWFGSLQQRQGFKGYVRDYRQVMNAYLSGFHRWKELTAVNREVQPMIDNVRAEGRQETARQLDDLLEYVWGKPSSTTLQFDNLINRVPVLRDYIKPLALDRWSRNIRSVAAFMTLTTVRFAVVNRLQPLQGLLPLLNEASLIRAKVLQHSAEGRALLDKSGVRFDPGQFTERGIGGRVSGVRERITGERSNQELAFLAMYEHGLSTGMTPEMATRYAKLRGQLMTQFTPLMSDTPVAMRDPVMAILFQFKRFPVKQVELLTRLAAEKNVPGIVRWAAGMAAMGGLNYAFRQLWSSDDKRKRLRDSIAKDHGTVVADGVMYGLPGLVGADISGSMVLGDEPFGANIFEKVGRSVTGPAVSIVANTAAGIQTARRFPGTPAEATADALRRYPTTRPLAELHSLATGNYDIRSPDGEAKYRRTLKEVLLGLGSFRSASESNTRAAIDAAVSLQKESSDLKNALWVKELSGTGAESEVKAIADFNSRWPEFAITNEEWRNYKAQRKAGLEKTDVERRVGKKYAPLLAP